MHDERTWLGLTGLTFPSVLKSDGIRSVDFLTSCSGLWSSRSYGVLRYNKGLAP
jgi:hypothetical protein